MFSLYALCKRYCQKSVTNKISFARIMPVSDVSRFKILPIHDSGLVLLFLLVAIISRFHSFKQDFIEVQRLEDVELQRMHLFWGQFFWHFQSALGPSCRAWELGSLRNNCCRTMKIGRLTFSLSTLNFNSFKSENTCICILN